MGLDMSYQAIPPESVLLKMATEKPNVAIKVGFHGFDPISEDYLKSYADDADFSEYAREAERVRREHSGIEKRQLYLGRRWDMLLYLLSENRRDPDTPFDENDLMYRAIHGGAEFGKDFCLPQGIPIRYVTPREVKEISKHFGQISADSLRLHWNPPKMWEAGVYKIHAEGGENTLAYLLEDFEKLKDFYLRAAIYNEGVLVFCD